METSMNKPILLSMIAAAFLLSTAQAQHTPYVGQEKRDIKSLSSDDIKQYLAGGGMGYARTAEFNGYPGPMHTLELADKLALTPNQRAAAEKLMAEHKPEARTLGAKLVDAERALDQLLASGKASESELAQLVRAAAALQGEFRLSHLETHRRLRPLLTEEQVNRYAQLRGYTGSQKPDNPHKH
jgi:Spy/CpxP family protein refolding chaperone